jgi:hypothetical protein
MARKQNLETTIESNRLPVSAGRLDQRLAGLALALRGVVAETQEMFIYPACQLDNDSLDELAVALVEFAEDITPVSVSGRHWRITRANSSARRCLFSSMWASRSQEGLVHAASGISSTFCGGN